MLFLVTEAKQQFTKQHPNILKEFNAISKNGQHSQLMAVSTLGELILQIHFYLVL